MSLPAVLVVDDDLNLRRIFEAKLLRCQFDVLAVSNLASARSALKSGKYSVAVIDERLPDGSSLSMLPALRDLAPNTSFVLITAYEENYMRERAKRAGACDVLFKPFDLDVLDAVVRSWAEDVACSDH